MKQDSAIASAPIFLGALLLFAVLAVYIPALGAGFVWDDPVLLTENPLMWLPGGLRDIWTGARTPDYIPLTLTGFWLEWRLWGTDPAGYHAVNIVLHAGNALLFWRLLVRLGIPGAWLAALFFGLHPMNVASVAWIAERKNTLSLFFALISVLLYLRDTKLRTALSVCFGLAAMLSKGTAVVLPAALLFMEIWRRPNATRDDWRRIALRLAPFAIAAGAMAWVTIHFQSHAAVAPHAPESLLFRIARASGALLFYAEKTLWPAGLAPIYPLGILDFGPFALLPVAVVLLGALWLAGSTTVVRRGVGFGLGVFVVSLLPVLGFVMRPAFFEQAPVADWWNYVPMLGICGLAGAGLARVAHGPGKALGWLAAVCIATAFGTLTWNQAATYFDMETFCRNALARNSHAWIARNNLGLALADRCQTEAAIEQYTLALRDNPNCLEAHTNLASSLTDQGKLKEAEGHLRTVLAAWSGDAKARNNLGIVLFQTGRTPEAIAEYRASLALFPHNGQAENNLGLALASTGQYAEALQCCRRALNLDPHNAGAWFNAGNALAAQGRHDAAASALRNATRCSPAMASASHRFAQELLLLGRPAEAEAELLRLFGVNPKMASNPAVAKTLEAARQKRGQSFAPAR